MAEGLEALKGLLQSLGELKDLPLNRESCK